MPDTDSCSSMQRFDIDERVQLVLPDTCNSDSRYRGTGVIVSVVPDDLGDLTGDPRDSFVYRVELESGETIPARDSDLTSVDSSEQQTGNQNQSEPT